MRIQWSGSGKWNQNKNSRNMNHTIELKEVSKYYTNEANTSLGLSKINLNLDSGEFVVITGESGSGKTTLLNVISGLDSIDEGELYYCGRDISTASCEKSESLYNRLIANIFQDYNLVNSYTVYQNIELVLLLAGETENLSKQVNNYINQVGLEEFANAKVSELSGGQKQRVAIARALAKNTPIIVADEPTANLDTVSAQEIIKIFHEASPDKLVIIVTHNYEQVEEFATRKILMKDGRIIEDSKFKNERVKTNKENNPVFEIHEQPEKMPLAGALRLGIRNAFNILPKFFLLLFINIFFISSLFLLHSSIKDREAQLDLLGNSTYYLNKSDKRLIIKKIDNSAFSDSEIAKLQNNENVDYIIQSDLSLDKPIDLIFDEEYFFGSVHEVSEIDKDSLTAGRLPQTALEAVIELNPNSGTYYTIAKDNLKNFLGKESFLYSDETENKLIPQKVAIVGIIINKNAADYNEKLYVNDELNKQILTAQISSACSSVVLFGNKQVSYQTANNLIPSQDVAAGQAFIFDNTFENYYDNETHSNKNINIKVKSNYFESHINLRIDKLITSKNIKEAVGLEVSEYENLIDPIFISPDDYRHLFDKGIFQISAMLKNPNQADKTIKDIESLGFQTLYVKDTLTDSSFGSAALLKMLGEIIQAILVIAISILVYFVIKMIIKSRTSYFLVLRLFGASKRISQLVLSVELMFINILAWIILAILAIAESSINPAISAISNIVSLIDAKSIILIFALSTFIALLVSLLFISKLYRINTISAKREAVKQ